MTRLVWLIYTIRNLEGVNTGYLFFVYTPSFRLNATQIPFQEKLKWWGFKLNKMAQKRMIDKKISVSEDVAQLTTEAQLLFTWMIPHADDAGLLPFSTRSIKALVVPMKDWKVEDIGFHLESIQKAKLIDLFEWEGDRFWHITNFHNHQTLKKDRNPQCIAKNLDTWRKLESIWKTLETQGAEVRKKEAEGVAVYENAKRQITNRIKSI